MAEARPQRPPVAVQAVAALQEAPQQRHRGGLGSGAAAEGTEQFVGGGAGGSAPQGPPEPTPRGGGQQLLQRRPEGRGHKWGGLGVLRAVWGGGGEDLGEKGEDLWGGMRIWGGD